MRAGDAARPVGRHARMWHMVNADPELSAIATNLDEVRARIDALALSLDREPTDRVAAELFETERALRSASRRLAAARRQLGHLGA